MQRRGTRSPRINLGETSFRFLSCIGAIERVSLIPENVEPLAAVSESPARLDRRAACGSRRDRVGALEAG